MPLFITLFSKHISHLIIPADAICAACPLMPLSFFHTMPSSSLLIHRHTQHVYYSYCSGDVVTLECVEKVIKKDMICPITGQKLKDSDIIVMQRVSRKFNMLYTTDMNLSCCRGLVALLVLELSWKHQRREQ